MGDCDWCGQPIPENVKPVPGYADLPTHPGCARDARRAYREDNGIERCDDFYEREPFTDWPNGQGTYD